MTVDMNAGAAQVNEFRGALRAHALSYDVQLSDDALWRLCDYYELLLAWNARLHLVAPCSPAEFASRHVLESLLLLPHLRANARLADVGSGAGLPAIPNLIVRPDLQVTLIEASKNKTVFLREALHKIDAGGQATVVAERFENLATPAVDYVTCRALDRFTEMFPQLVRWSPPDSTLLFFGGNTLRKQIETAGLNYTAVSIPQSERRFLFVCRNRDQPGPISTE